MFSWLSPYLKLIRFDKPIGTLLLLWPSYWALWISGVPDVKWVLIFTIGAFLTRSAGCIINDISDRKLDGYVERTKQRPLVNGDIKLKAAVIFFIFLILFSCLLLLFLPMLCSIFALMAFAMMCLYPFMKRYTFFPQAVLGIAFSMSIPMVYAVNHHSIDLTCVLLFLANTVWTVAYDTIYAMVDRDDDIKIGIKSTAILFGNHDKKIIIMLDVAMMLMFILIGSLNKLGLCYYLSILGAILLFAHQYRLIAHRQRENCFRAFLNNNYVGMILFFGIFFNSLLA